MGGSSKKGGDDNNDIPHIDPSQLIAQAIAANRVNVNTPYGSQTYGANGLTTTLTPEMQAILTQQMARAGGPAAQYQLPSQNADVLNGLNTRLDQRYGIPVPQTPSSGGGGSSGGTTPPPPTPTPPPPSTTPPPPPADTGGGGGYGGYTTYDPPGGDFCVAVDSWLPYDVRADAVQVGDLFPVHTPEKGFHNWRVESVGGAQYVPCSQLETKGGAVLRCSNTTPFNFLDATADLDEKTSEFAPNMLGHKVYVRTPAGVIDDEVIRVTDLGKGWVQPISFGGRSFPAGDTPTALIFSHNIMKSPRVPTEILAQGGDYSMASQVGGMDNLTGSLTQGQAGIASYNPGSYTMGSSGNYVPVSANALTNTASPYKSDPTSKSDSTKDASAAQAQSGGFGLPPIERLPNLPTPEYLQHSWLDSPLTKAAALLLGPAAAVGLGAYNHYRHRNDK